MLNKYMFSFGQGIIAASPSIKNVKSGDKNASFVIELRRTVMELKSISSVISRTLSCIIAFTSFTPSKKNIITLYLYINKYYSRRSLNLIKNLNYIRKKSIH